MKKKIYKKIEQEFLKKYLDTFRTQNWTGTPGIESKSEYTDC